MDLLGLGMMAVLKEWLTLVPEHCGELLDLAQLPEDEEIIERCSVPIPSAMFQVESQAQKSSLLNNRRGNVYEVMVQVATIRLGPILGKMKHPYMRRRLGLEKVTYPHPSLAPMPKQTLGLPLFQEQLLRMAMVVVNFTGSEAEKLRHAVGMQRSWERTKNLEGRLHSGMKTNGLDAATQETIIQNIPPKVPHTFGFCGPALVAEPGTDVFFGRYARG